MSPARWPLLGALILLAAGRPLAEAAPAPGECSGPGGAGRPTASTAPLMPSAGIVADCAERPRLPRRLLLRRTRAGDVAHAACGHDQHAQARRHLAQRDLRRGTRFGCGPGCTWSYFFEAKRRLLSAPRRDVLEADYRRLLMAQVEGRALAVRQIFTAREALRIERDWAPGLTARRGHHGDPLRS